MSLKRIILLTLALLAVSATAALAGVTWQKGDYKGKTEGKFKPAANKPLRQAKLSFHVGRHKLPNGKFEPRVSQIKVEMRVKCADGSHTSFRTEHTGYLTIDSNGHFAGGAPTQTGRDNIQGNVSGTHAAGFVRSFDKEDAQGNEDPNGQQCDSGRVKWTADKQG
jgi:hypothetical protein